MVAQLCSQGSGANRCPGSGSLSVSRVSAAHPNTAWRPIPPTLHQTLARASPETPRRTLIGYQRYYGESPVRLRRDGRAAGDAVPAFHRRQRRTRNCGLQVPKLQHVTRISRETRRSATGPALSQRAGRRRGGGRSRQRKWSNRNRLRNQPKVACRRLKLRQVHCHPRTWWRKKAKQRERLQLHERRRRLYPLVSPC